MLGVDLAPRDDTLWGWLIVGVYLLAAALAVGSGLVRRRRLDGPARLEWFWYVFALAMLALAVNKQLDLHVGLSRFARRSVWEAGWYGERQLIQTWFVRGVLVAAVFGTAALVLVYRRGSIQHWVAIGGLVALLGFIAIRAASLHDLDAILFARLAADLNASRVLELGGALLLAAAALWAIVAPARRQPPPPRVPDERPAPLARVPSAEGR